MLDGITATVLSALLVLPGILTTAQPGTWSSKAQYLWPGPTALADLPSGGRHLSLDSPDGRYCVVVDDNELQISDTTRSVPPTLFALGSLAEVLWAPTSDALVVTESDGGWVGTWTITVYRLGNAGIDSSLPMGFVLADFKQRYPNCPEEYPNVAAVDWVQGSRQLALVVEMPCHSSCADMCDFLGYIVDPSTGVIARRLSIKEVRREWSGAIGPRLDRAP